MRPAFTNGICIGLSLAAISGWGCGKRISDANLREVRPDMSTKEVESILGQPSRVQSHDLPLQTQQKTLNATVYTYEQGGKTVDLFFVGDKLVSPGGIQGSFGD